MVPTLQPLDAEYSFERLSCLNIFASATSTFESKNKQMSNHVVPLLVMTCQDNHRLLRLSMCDINDIDGLWMMLLVLLKEVDHWPAHLQTQKGFLDIRQRVLLL